MKLSRLKNLYLKLSQYIFDSSRLINIEIDPTKKLENYRLRQDFEKLNFFFFNFICSHENFLLYYKCKFVLS